MGYFKWDSGQAETPPEHASTHENGGDDEISVAGLSGELADAQTPKTHASTHQSGGADAIKLDDLAAPDDNTDLDVSTTRHGLVPKAPDDTEQFLRGDGSWAGLGITGYVPLDTILSSTSYDGDLFSSQSKTLIDLSAVFGAPAGIKAILLLGAVSDAGSAGTDCRVYVGPTNTAYVGTAFNCSPVNSRPGRAMQMVNCNADGDVYLQIIASGTNTMAITFQIHGYWVEV